MIPYLSIVVVSRNDNHGGKLPQRMQHFVDSLGEQTNRYKLPTELVIVEWNPPEDHALLKDALSWSKCHGYLSVRIITVPYEIHSKFLNSDMLPLYQMIGKNVGIYRANGKYILATNIDNLFSNELIEFIAKQKLISNVFYRVNRIDVDENLPIKSVDEKIEYCRNNVIRVNSKHYITNLINLKSLMHDIIDDPHLLKYYFKKLIHKNNVPSLHYNACGDFTLMSKSNWFAIGGYLELEMYSLHIDSILLMAASNFGLREVVLDSPLEIYHMHHESGITPGNGQKLLLEKFKRNGVPVLSWRECVNIGTKYTINPRWGLKNITFAETVII